MKENKENKERKKRCPYCKGSGWYGRFGDCTVCDGTGYVSIDYKE